MQKRLDFSRVRVGCKDDEIAVVLRKDLRRGGRLRTQEIIVQLAERHRVIAIRVGRADAALPQGICQRERKVRRAVLLHALRVQIPVPGLLVAAAGGEHLVFRRGKGVRAVGKDVYIHALADERARIARIEDDQLGAGNIIEDGAQIHRGHGGFRLSVGEQQDGRRIRQGSVVYAVG